MLRVFGESNREVSELGWKVGVQEKNTHGLPSMNRSLTKVGIEVSDRRILHNAISFPARINLAGNLF
jgi:hypothetical protein